MARTFRNRHKHTDYTSKAHFLSRTWTSWYTGETEPFYDITDWQRYGRDCSKYSSYRKKGYRSLTNEIIRNKNRKAIARIMQDPDAWENMTFADKVDGKVHIYDFW